MHKPFRIDVIFYICVFFSKKWHHLFSGSDKIINRDRNLPAADSFASRIIVNRKCNRKSTIENRKLSFSPPSWWSDPYILHFGFCLGVIPPPRMGRGQGEGLLLSGGGAISVRGWVIPPPSWGRGLGGGVINLSGRGC